MPRRLRPIRSCLSLAAAVLLGPSAAWLPGQSNGAQAQESVPSPAAALTVAQARSAATRILDAVKSGNANARYAQFSEELKAITSPAMVQATIRTQPKVLSYQLLSVRSGIGTSTVEAELTTSAGPRVLFLVLNDKGQIARYYVDRADDPTSKVALQFLQAVSTGNFITAHSFLSPQFQKEITPQALQSKWLNLQRLTGAFVSLGRAVEAESTADARLVLVNAQFNRLSDNIFVILNDNNQVTGVDFPAEPHPPQAVR